MSQTINNDFKKGLDENFKKRTTKINIYQE